MISCPSAYYFTIIFIISTIRVIAITFPSPHTKSLELHHCQVVTLIFVTRFMTLLSLEQEVPSWPAGIFIKDLSCVMTSHPPEGVDEAGHGGALPVPGLPQVEDGLSGTGLGPEEGDVPVDPQPVRQQPPVVVGGGRLVQQLGQALLHCQGDSEGRSPV